MAQNNKRRLQIDWRRGLIPISLFILFILRFGLGAPIWVLILFCLWIPVYYLFIPYYTAKRWTAFEKNFNRRFQRGEHKTLLEDYRKERFLRRFGPREVMLQKLGLIYSAMGKFREAELAIEQAIDATKGSVSEQLLFNLANIKFELGKFDEAMKIYLTLRGNSPYQRAARTQMALIDLHRGARVEQAVKFLEDERERATGSMRERIDRALTSHS